MAREYVSRMDSAADAALLRHAGLGEACVRTMRIGTLLLERGVLHPHPNPSPNPNPNPNPNLNPALTHRYAATGAWRASRAEPRADRRAHVRAGGGGDANFNTQPDP